MKSGLQKIQPNHKDYSLLHTFAGITPEPAGLPDSFSIYDGRTIPNQDEMDTRFTPAISPLPYGCTGETGSFESGLQDGVLYNPEDLYINTPPGGLGGRDIRKMLQTLISRGPRAADGSFGAKRTAYFNVYGAGKIDDFDAVRIALWINQMEKRGVYIGSWWYWGDAPSMELSLPSFKTSDGALHCYLATGWKGNDLEIIPWVGEEAGNKGVFYVSREIFNALMGQPYTGTFSITKVAGQQPIPVGYQAYIDHIVYSLNQFIRNLFGT